MKHSILLLAGEPSGDMLGAEVMRQLSRKHKELCFVGVGGPYMRKAGLKPLADITDFPGMGLVEVIPAIPRLMRLLTTITTWAAENKPALCLCLDNQDFSARAAARLAPLGVPCFLYAAPKVWAWRQGRVHKVKKLFMHIFCLFPFEVDFFTKHGVKASYVGHPVVGRMQEVIDHRSKVKEGTAYTLAILPGSRSSELNYHWPVFLKTFQRLRKLEPNLTGLVAVENATVVSKLKTMGWDDALEVVVGDKRHAAIAGCTAALTKSGTNNLELALLGVPAVVGYKAHWLTAAIVRRLIQVKYGSPPDPILGRCVYPEFIQEAMTPENLSRVLLPLLRNAKARASQVKLLLDVEKHLEVSQNPVHTVAAELGKYL